MTQTVERPDQPEQPVVLHALLDNGKWPLWSRTKRLQLGRCLSCEWHPLTQGHHAYCPARED